MNIKKQNTNRVKTKLYCFFCAFFIYFYGVNAAVADTQDNLDSLKVVYHVLITGNTHTQKNSREAMTARLAYEKEKKDFFTGFQIALNQKKSVNAVSKIVSECFNSMATIMQTQIGPVALSQHQCEKIKPEAKSRLIWNIAELTATSQTPSVRAATRYIGSKVINHCAGPRLFSESREAISYKKETGLLKNATKSLQEL